MSDPRTIPSAHPHATNQTVTITVTKGLLQVMEKALDVYEKSPYSDNPLMAEVTRIVVTGKAPSKEGLTARMNEARASAELKEREIKRETLPLRAILYQHL